MLSMCLRMRSPRSVAARVGCQIPHARPCTRNASSRSAGLVGMPNVGKSTLFNALVRQQLAQASNFPFCTIEPNVALVEVPDERLQRLAVMENSQRCQGWQLEFHDIAGLIAGASKGEGLGNAFLGNIRATNAILQVVRCFDDPGVIHVLDQPDPLRDIAIIENELVLADLQSVEKRQLANKKAKTAEAITQARLLAEVKPILEAGLPARSLLASTSLSPSDLEAWNRLQLLTQKPMLYVCNVSEEDAAIGNDMTRAVADHVTKTAAAGAASSAGTSDGEKAAGLAVVCAKLEAEAGALADADRDEFLQAYGLKSTGLDVIVKAAADLLSLQPFYTVGPTESRAWCIRKGWSAPQAAGVIHSDMQTGFIKAEVMAYEDVIAHKGEAGGRKAGLVRQEGKDYVMKEGDVCFFKFNAAKK